MVIPFQLVGSAPPGWWAAAEQTRPLIQQLDPPTRAKVLAALAGLVILGFALMMLAWLGARVTRRYMNPLSIGGRSQPSTKGEDDWARRQVIPRQDARQSDDE